jgi:drug/metabolite transporter (DMT)-like permease
LTGTSRPSGDKRGYVGVKAAAIILIVVGVGIVIWGAFGFKTREKVLDVGPIHATKDEEHNVPYGPLAGALIAIGGVVLLIKSKR